MDVGWWVLVGLVAWMVLAGTLAVAVGRAVEARDRQVPRATVHSTTDRLTPVRH